MRFLKTIVFLKPLIYERIYGSLHSAWSGLTILYVLDCFRRKDYPRHIDNVFMRTQFFFAICLALPFLYMVTILHKTYFDFMHLYTLMAGIFFSLLAYAKGTERMSLIRTGIFSAGCISIVALYSLFFTSSNALLYLKIHNIRYPFVEEFLSRQRAFFPFVSPDTLGGFLSLTIFPTLALTNKKSKLIIALLVLQIITLALTKSIGAYFSFLAGLLLYVYCKQPRKLSLYPYLGIILGGLLAVGILFFIRQSREPLHLTPYVALKNRVQYYRDGIEMIKQHPWAGWGLGHFYKQTGTKYAHNIIIQLWSESGVLSVVAFLIMIGVTIKRGLRLVIRQTKQGSDMMIVALFCAYCAFLLHNLIDFEFLIFQASFLWWLYMGFIHYEFTKQEP